MTQDFAKTGTQRKTRKRSPSPARSGNKTSRSNNPRSSHMQQSQVPAWVWIFTGIVAGAFIMFLVYLSGLAPEAIKPADKPSAAVQDVQENLKDKTKPVFEFYDRLMNSEVVVDTGTQEPLAPEEKVIYTLQAASFQKYEEADALKALLTLEGLDVQIQDFAHKGETWHRVMVGPFDSRSKMASARSALAQHDITPITLKQKP